MLSSARRLDKNAEEFALRLLARKDYSQAEMRQKLGQKGFSLTEIENVLHKLSTHQLLNDLRYAQNLANFYGKQKFWGPWRIKHKLKEKGIGPDLAEEVVAQEEKIFPAEERLKKLLEKKLKNRNLSEFSNQELKKLANQLYRYGYSWEEITNIFSREGGLTEE